MSFNAVVMMYGGVNQPISLKATNAKDAAREAYARCFCKTAGLKIPDDYNGSQESHQRLLEGVNDKFLYGFLENLNREKWSDTGALQSVIAAVPNKISILEVIGVHPCDRDSLYQEWLQFIVSKIKTLEDKNTQAEIARLEQDLVNRQAQLAALRKK